MNINEIKQNPVRDYLLVEKGDATISRMPLGMQPASRNVVTFLRNASVGCGCNFLPRDIPYGNRLTSYNVDTKSFIA